MNSHLFCLAGLVVTAATLSCPATAVENQTVAAASTLVRTYQVNKRVAEFPTNEDFSTPEAAYATIHRIWADEGNAAWPRLSIQTVAARLPAAPKKPLPPEQSRRLLEAEVLEVHVYCDTNAVVLSRMAMGRKNGIDLRWLRPENGRWLNCGNDVADNLELARRLLQQRSAYLAAQNALSSRPPVANPPEHLRTFTSFLRANAREPGEFILEAIRSHRLVIVGEVHHRPRFWDFNSRLVKSPEFTRHAGVIYLELPSHGQSLVDAFLAAPAYDPLPIIQMLRDMLWMGWPDQPMLDFFKAVWQTNRELTPEYRLRIVLVDMARPWNAIQTRQDWSKYDADRDELMAGNIIKDMSERTNDSRHALFVVGYAHAIKNMSRPGGDPVKSAGWHLRQKLADTNVFAVFPHSPVMSNNGDVGGRLALGLFETAFASLANRPMAFPLDDGPFGEQVFDASMDHLTLDTFRQGFDAYLYLGALEDEMFSPLIPGFYTDKFVNELDRRSRLMTGRGLLDGGEVKSLDAAGVVAWMSRSWGQPRREWSARQLGPLNAWQWGSDWENRVASDKLKTWTRDKEMIRGAALKLLEAIRAADYDEPGPWQTFPAPDVEYVVGTDAPAWVGWVCQHFRTNPISKVELGETQSEKSGWPAVPYELSLRDGSKIKGLLPMRWLARGQMWCGVEGLDWHLQPAAGESDQARADSDSTLPPKTRMMHLVDDFFRHNFRDITSREPLEWGEVTASSEGTSSIRFKYRARIWGQTTITNDQVFTFDRQGKFISVSDAR